MSIADTLRKEFTDSELVAGIHCASSEEMWYLGYKLENVHLDLRVPEIHLYFQDSSVLTLREELNSNAN